MRELYLGNGTPGVIVYNAVMGAPDRLLSSSVAHDFPDLPAGTDAGATYRIGAVARVVADRQPW
jgi:hypothetical protein